MKQLGLIWLIAGKDLRIEYRSRNAFLTTLFFAVLILIIFNFAFDPGSLATREAAPGILWVALIFPGVIQLNRSFQSEAEEGTLAAIILSPLERGVVFLGKFFANWIFLLIIDLLILLAFVIFYNFAFSGRLLWILLLLLAGSAGFTAVGTVFAAMLTNVRARDVLLPVLLFPIIVPIILAAVNATQEVLLKEELRFYSDWLRLLLVFDVIYLTTGYLVFDYVVAE